MNMQSEEVFLGFHLTSRINADSLLHLVKTSLLSFDLPFSGIRGQGYDGASNMSGNKMVYKQSFLLKIQMHCIYIALVTNSSVLEFL